MERSSKKRVSPRQQQNNRNFAAQSGSGSQTSCPTLLRRRLQPKRVKNAVPGPKVLLGLAALCVSLLWTVSLLFFGLNVDQKDSALNNHKNGTRLGGGASSSSSSSRFDMPLSDLPPHELQLWPDDTAQDELFKFLTHCSGKECYPPARKTTNNFGNIEAETLVILVRPPGVFGSLVEEFVEVLLEKLNEEEVRFELESHRYPPDLSDLQEKTQNVRLIRVVTSPILLEAVDLALIVNDGLSGDSNGNTNNNNFYSKRKASKITWKDVQEIVRLLVRWQSEINAIAAEIPAMLITLQSTLLIPQKNEDRLVQFLQGEEAPKKEQQQQQDAAAGMVVPRDELAKRAMHRVDACTRFLMGIDPPLNNKGGNNSNKNNKGGGPLNVIAQKLIDEEIKATTETTKSLTMMNRITQQVYSFLHMDDGTVCATFPQYCDKGPNGKPLIVAF